MEFGLGPARITPVDQSSGVKQLGYSHEGTKLRPGQCQCGSDCYMTHTEAHIPRTPVTDRACRSSAVPVLHTHRGSYGDSPPR